MGSTRLQGSPPSLAADYAVCRDIMQRASRNYSYASTFLPADKLHHVEALYAFLRVGDDRVDVSHEGFASPLDAIEDWERSYARAFESGESDHPVMRAYLATAIERGIPAHTMDDYFRAMRDDLTKTRFETWDDLRLYMAGSAVPVGRAMTHILGVRGPWRLADAMQGADSLSEAMQLTNFLRDVGEDWRMGRVYLPGEDMDAFGVSERDLAEARVTRDFVELMEFEMARAESLYRKARTSVPMLASGRWGVMSGLEIYRAIMDGIRRNGYDVFARRAGSSRSRKLALAGWAFVRTALPQITRTSTTPVSAREGLKEC